VGLTFKNLMILKREWFLATKRVI